MIKTIVKKVTKAVIAVGVEVRRHARDVGSPVLIIVILIAGSVSGIKLGSAGFPTTCPIRITAN